LRVTLDVHCEYGNDKRVNVANYGKETTMSKRGNNEGSIYQRNDGQYCGAVSRGIVNGKPKRQYFTGKTRAEVAAKVNRALQDVQDGTPVISAKQTLGQFLARWLEDSVKLTVAPRTYKSYSDTVRLHIEPAIGRIPLAQLTPQHVQKMMRAATTPRNADYARRVLRVALNRALKWGDVTRNVATLADSPRITDRKEVEPLSPEAVKQLMATLHGDRLESLYIVAIWMGLREGELLGLRWKDIDTERQQLTVQNQVQRIDGRLTLTTPKTRRSHRPLPMSPTVVNTLEQHKLRQEQEKLLNYHRWQDNDLVFPTSIGSFMDARNLVRHFHNTLTRAGLPQTNFHTLRHSCASFLYASGAQDREVMEMLRHSQISLTMNTYTHLRMSVLHETSNRLDAMLNNEP